MAVFRYCGLLNRQHDVRLCNALRSKDKTTGKIGRIRCGYLLEDECTYITKEEKLAADNKAAKKAEVEDDESRTDEERSSFSESL